ncbi:amidohydrolase [Aquimarina sp. AD10]|uniref:Amidohydrolase n=1 Tax=Aquimarina aggregata TaxID=1642818 RepID=A0A162XK80_9FLAO|nr:MULTISPECIES: amidohydrolase family protein [Aquimarina]AXT60254.1 amidohydrolase [Aquimarina sp. AD10]KZS38686.1 amidohydrolase [Aquimarina aggregata]RKN01311.1 amidohydrolase [Aquimarina sp. AD10]
MKKFLFIILTILVTSCAQPQKQISKTAILITDATIINVLDGSLQEKQQIVIDSGKIKSISNIVENADKYTTHINASGKYVLPGLAEMHAHIPQPSTNKERIEDVLFLYLSNGITTIRGMLGHPTHLKLRQEANTNQIVSPRIFTSSPSLNGNSIKTKEEAITKVTAYKKEGYDFLKIHPGIKLDVFNQVVKTAKDVGIPFSGHVPVDVGVRNALKSKYASIDHIDGFLEGLVPESENVNPNDNGFFGYNFTPLADESKIEELVQLANSNEIWIVPTQSLYERWFAPITAEELLKDPEMKYMPASTLQNWKERKGQYTKGNPNFNEPQWKQFNNIRRKLLKQLNDNGGRILLGSDAPQLFNVPGFSIHHEIDGMIGAGLTPLQIIQSGTINPAKFLGKEDTFGQIKVGLDADILILNANPIDNIKALQQINGVLYRGQWLSKKTIESKLEKIAIEASKN